MVTSVLTDMHGFKSFAPASTKPHDISKARTFVLMHSQAVLPIFGYARLQKNAGPRCSRKHDQSWQLAVGQSEVNSHGSTMTVGGTALHGRHSLQARILDICYPQQVCSHTCKHKVWMHTVHNKNATTNGSERTMEAPPKVFATSSATISVACSCTDMVAASFVTSDASEAGWLALCCCCGCCCPFITAARQSLLP